MKFQTKHRVLSLLLAALLTLALSACGGKTAASAPEGMAEGTFTAGSAVLEIVDDYLDGGCTAAEASEQISPYAEDFTEVETADSNETLYNELVQLSVESIQYNLDAIADGTSSGNDQVESDREVLAAYLEGKS